jgi:hypothetical protein
MEAFEVLVDAYPKALHKEANVQRNLLTLSLHARGSPTALVKYLLQRSPSLVCIVDSQGYLPLHEATRLGNLNCLALIYTAYPEAIQMTCNDTLPLHIAIDLPYYPSTNMGIIRFLLKQYPGGVQAQSPPPATTAAAADDFHEGVENEEGLGTVYELSGVLGVDDYIVRLLLQACPDADPERAKELNYEARKPLMFLAFAARTDTEAMRSYAAQGSACVSSDGFIHQLRRLMNIGDDLGLLRHIASFL